jgi:hypothetical protein
VKTICWFSPGEALDVPVERGYQHTPQQHKQDKQKDYQLVFQAESDYFVEERRAFVLGLVHNSVPILRSRGFSLVKI